MSRLRRPFLSDRYLFVTVRLLPRRGRRQEEDFKRLASSVARMRGQQGFVLTAWVFLPDHWHAIIYPPHPLTIARALESLKVASTISINLGRRQSGEPLLPPRAELWQGRFFDRALRTVKESHETLEYIHLNPVRRGLVNRAEDWKWSSLHEYAGVSAEEQERRCGLTIDRVRLPADENTRI
jgi:putative transposase